MKKLLLAAITFSLLVLDHFARAEAQPPNALTSYVEAADPSFSWSVKRSVTLDDARFIVLSLTSQTWRGVPWNHQIGLIVPNALSNVRQSLLFITGKSSPDSFVEFLQQTAVKTGTITAVIGSVPNQPLFGRTEDTLIAHTFDQYLQTNDATWPLLLPMTKAAVAAMNAVSQYAQAEYGAYPTQFVVTGASKRGWTSWLTGAVDERVNGVAPQVFDMLNMPEQTAAAERAYGRQSEQIAAYTELGLVNRINEPPMVRLRSWVDPISYRAKLDEPKLIILGTNDPYWVVDAQQYYLPKLTGALALHQVPNAGHDAGGTSEARQALITWYSLIARNIAPPSLSMTLERAVTKKPTASITADGNAKEISLWSADSDDRDFRDARWSQHSVAQNARRVIFGIAPSDAPLRAFLARAVFETPEGDLTISSQVTVAGR